MAEVGSTQGCEVAARKCGRGPALFGWWGIGAVKAGIPSRFCRGLACCAPSDVHHQETRFPPGRGHSDCACCYFACVVPQTNVKINWTRSLLRYMLHRRYSSASSSTPALLEVMEDREAYANHYGLGPYAGGEVFPCVWSALADTQGNCAAEAREMLCLSERGEARKAEDGGGQSSDSRLEEHTQAMSTQHQQLMPACSAERDTRGDEEFERGERERRKTELGEALLKAAFVAVVLGEEEFLVPLLEETAT